MATRSQSPWQPLTEVVTNYRKEKITPKMLLQLITMVTFTEQLLDQ